MFIASFVRSSRPFDRDGYIIPDADPDHDTGNVLHERLLGHRALRVHHEHVVPPIAANFANRLASEHSESHIRHSRPGS